MARTQKIQTTRQKPPQLDLNITALRNDANEKMSQVMRAYAKRLEDLDAVERVLNAELPEQLRTALAEATSTNGRNGHHHHQPRISRHIEEPDDTTEEPRAGKGTRRKHPRKLRGLVPAAVGILIQEPNGLDTPELAHRLRAIGALNPKGPLAAALTAVRGTMKHARNDRLVTADIPSPNERSQGKQAHYYAAPGAADALAAMTIATPGNGGAQFDPTLGMRDAVFEAFMSRESGEKLTPLELTEILIAGGFPKVRGKNKLNLHVSWALRGMHRTHTVTKFPNGTFALKRPNVHVTKHD